MSEWEMLQQGILHHRQGQYREAQKAYEAILGKNSQNADANHLLGLLFLQTGNLMEAEKLVLVAMRQNKKNCVFVKTMAQILFKKNEASKALGLLDKHSPPIESQERIEWYGLRGDLAYSLGRISQAVIDYQMVLKLEPEHLGTLLNLGILYTQQKRFSEADILLSKAQFHNPESLDVLKAIASLNQLRGELGLAAKMFIEAFTKNSHDLDSARTAAMILLALGDWKNGWDYYRVRASVFSSGNSVQPDVTEFYDFKGKSVCILREQGLGDELFFMRFAPQLLMAGAKRVVYQSDSKVVEILRRAFGEVEVDSDFSEEKFDIRLSLGDLPYLLRHQNFSKTPESFRVSPLLDKTEAVLRLWPQLLSGFWLGLTWKAGGQPMDGINKTRWLEKEIPIYEVRDLLGSLRRPVVILQRNPDPMDLQVLQRHCEKIGVEYLDLSHINEDLELMLAVLDQVSDYVCVSNTNVHLREMLGKRSHVFVPFPPEFRYQITSDSSPWFAHAKVYRQDFSGSWNQAFFLLKENLL